MIDYPHDTIVAIATGQVYAGIGIVRISGSDNLSTILEGLTHKSTINARYAYYGNFFAADNSTIDSGIMLFFAAPDSFTGENIIELQGHGSPVVLNMLLKRCVELGCRLATAGEFSQRAYFNNKLDLLQAESIIDLIHADTEAAAQAALRSVQGEFSTVINSIKYQLIHTRMLTEALIDFSEEEISLPDYLSVINKQLQAIIADLTAMVHHAKQGILLNNGINIVIIGQPNVGKSTLLNVLAAEEVALVSSIAGTTRDAIKHKMIINNLPINIIDTAGIHNSQDTVECLGITKALLLANQAQLCLFMLDSTLGITSADKKLISQLGNIPLLYIYNKIDLSEFHPHIQHNAVYLSTLTKQGIDLLKQQLISMLEFTNIGNQCSARIRHVEAINMALTDLNIIYNEYTPIELMAEALRNAHHHLALLTGEYSTEDLLGAIFANFCIGK